MKTARHYWMPVAPDGWGCTEILAERRYNAVAALLGKPWRETMGKTWAELQGEGWRVVKVKVVPAESPTPCP